MKDKISKFINLQGKYLTSLLFVLFFAVGQMWAAEITYTLTNTACLAEGTYVTGTSSDMIKKVPVTITDADGNNALTLNCVIYNNKKTRSIARDGSKGLKFDRPGAIYVTFANNVKSISIKVNQGGKFGPAKSADTYAGISDDSYSNLLSVDGDPLLTLASNTEATYNTTELSAGTYKIVSSQDLSGSSSWGLVTLKVEYATSSSPVDPTASFSNGDYTIGGSDLDLSTLFTTNSEGTVEYSISDANGTGAALRADGKRFYATTAGTATVAVAQAATSAHNAFNATATITVSAPVAVTGITITPASPEVMVGNTVALSATITPDNASDKTVTWSVKSGSESYAEVSATGVVTGLAEGSATIRATANDGSGVYAEKVVAVAAAPAPCYTFTAPLPAEAVTYAVNDVVAGSDAGGEIKVLGNTIKNTAYGLSFESNSSAKVEVTLGSLMKEGTQISVTVLADYKDNNNRGLLLQNGSGTKKADWLWKPATDAVRESHNFTYTVVAGDGLAGSNVFRIARSTNAIITSLTVSNCGAELLALSSAVSVAGKATVTLSKSLVAAGGTATASYSDLDSEYEFDGWEITSGDATIADATAATAAITMGTTASVITLKLKEAGVKYAVHFDSKGGSAVDDQLVDKDGYASVPTAPTKFKYTFGGWSETDGGSTPADLGAIAITAEKTFYAIWTPKVCPTSGTIFSLSAKSSGPASEVKWTNAENEGVRDVSDYFDVVNGIAALVNNSSSNNQVSITTDPKMKFSNDANGWAHLRLECALAEGDVITLDNTNKCIVSYTADKADGTTYTLPNSSSHTITVPASWAGEDELYIFRNGSNFYISSISIVRPVKYAVTFNMHDHGTAPDAQSIVEGGKVTEPSAPTAEGWSFGGWYKEDTYDNAWDFATDVVGTSAVELHAKWTAWPTMTLNRGAATSGDDVVTSVEPGSAVTVPACPFSYTDYNFNGWEYSPAVTMVDETHFTMPSENLTLTAQWVDANNVAQIGSTKYATFAEAAAAVADGETIQLLQDCDYDATWTITGMAVTLDLNGKNLTGPASGDAVAITTDGVLTIMDGTATVDPSINGSNEITYAAGKFTGEWLINVYAGGSFVMNSGWLLSTEAAVWVTNSGIVTVNNGVLEALTNAVVMGPGNAGKGGYTMNIHGGILLGHMSASGIANGYSSMAVYHPNTGTLNIDGGTLISENGPGVVVRGGASNITGGTIIAQGNGGGKCGDASAPLIGEVGVAYDFKANYPGVSSVAATISGTANVSGADGAVQAIYAATEPTATEEAAVAISGGTFNTPVAEALCADDYYPATKPSGKYGVTYAAESIDFEAFIDENGTDDAAKTLLASQLAAKHYELSEALNTDHLDAPAGKPQDKGLKVKKTGLEIYFSVEDGKVLELKTGNISGASIAINGGAAEDLTSTSIATHTYYNDNAQAVVLRMTKADNKYNIFQSINIRNPYLVTLDATTNGGEAVAPMYGKLSVTLPSATKGTDHFIGWYDRAEEEGRVLVGLADAEYTPTADVTLYAHFAAQSNDGRLSDLQVDGTTVDGFDMDVHTYNLTVPYGTAIVDLPKITLATAYDSYAQGVSIYPTDGPEWRADVDGGCYVQQANVTAEDGSVVYNQVRTKILPKDMACLIKATVTGDNAMAIDASASIYEGTESIYRVYGNAETYEAKSAPKFQSDGYLGVTLTTTGAAFQQGDIVRVFATKGIDNVAKLYVYSDNTGTAAKQIAESETALVKGYNEAALTAAGEGATSVFLCRAGQYTSWNPCIYDIAVYRAYPNPLVNTITFNGAAGTVDNDLKTITVEVPASTNLATMPVEATFLSNDPSQTNGAVTGSWAEGDNEYIVTDKDNDQTVYTVTINKAVPSSDATLSALSYGTPATAIALEDGVFEYNVLLPYGTTDVPALAATPNHAGANIMATADADAFVNRHATSTVTVKAEDDATTQVYTVNFTVDRYQTTVLWDGSTMDEFSDITELTVVKAGDVEVAGKNASFEGKNYTKCIQYSGATSNSRYFGLTIPAGKVAKVSIVYRPRSNSERSIMIGTAIAGAIDESAIVYETTQHDNLAKLTADIFAAGTIYINTTNGFQVFEIDIQLADGHGRSAMLGAGVYGTVCVDHNVDIEDIQGVTVYELMGRDYSNYGKLAFDEIISGELVAGKPYVFQAHRNHMALLYGETVVTEPVDAGNGMYGTFVYTELTELTDVYYFAQRALWSCDDLTVLKIPANRAYVKLSEVGEVPSSTPAPGRRRVTMTVNGEKVATGMDDVQGDQVQSIKVLIDGQLYILRGEKMFDATGRLVK